MVLKHQQSTIATCRRFHSAAWSSKPYLSSENLERRMTFAKNYVCIVRRACVFVLWLLVHKYSVSFFVEVDRHLAHLACTGKGAKLTRCHWKSSAVGWTVGTRGSLKGNSSEVGTGRESVSLKARLSTLSDVFNELQFVSNLFFPFSLSGPFIKTPFFFFTFYMKHQRGERFN